MKYTTKTTFSPPLAIALLLTTAGTGFADVKTGVDAWAQGDYSKAVREWQPFAQAGDADALYNMGQAYKLGRGVSLDLSTALEYYHKAAAKGHLRAEDNYGLLLFQQNHRVEAMPYIQRSAERGEARARYIYGIAMFNGDLAPKDWVKAYAMMSLAAKTDLPQAVSSLTLMDEYISQEDRAKGLALAANMEKQQAARLAMTSGNGSPSSAPVVGNEPPATLGATAAPKQNAAAKPSSPAPAPKATTPPAPKPAPVPAQAQAGKWRIQLGAFGDPAGAERLWKSLSAKVSGLSGYQHYMEKSRSVTRLQAGPVASREAAAKLCEKIKAAGNDCLIKAP